MKKIISSAILLFFLSNFAFAIGETDYEKKLEYKRKKIQLLIKTRMVGETSAYTDFDTWSSTISPEAGYSYTYTSGQSRTGASSTVREVSDWVVVRGGVRELSDVEFLNIVGDPDTAGRVQSSIDERGKWQLIGNITGVIGIGIAIAGSSSGQTGTITTGGIISLVGFVISSFNYQPKHYIPADFALEQTDLYNIRIKKELGLPIDLE